MKVKIGQSVSELTVTPNANKKDVDRIISLIKLMNNPDVLIVKKLDHEHNT